MDLSFIFDNIITIVTIFVSAGVGAVINHFTHQKKETVEIANGNVEDKIRAIAKSEMVDPDLAVRVARCESGLKQFAINVNAGGSRDRGIFQINEKYHPTVTDSQAFDIEFSTRFFCKAFKNGNLYWWNASRHCWDK